MMNSNSSSCPGADAVGISVSNATTSVKLEYSRVQHKSCRCARYRVPPRRLGFTNAQTQCSRCLRHAILQPYQSVHARKPKQNPAFFTYMSSSLPNSNSAPRGSLESRPLISAYSCLPNDGCLALLVHLEPPSLPTTFPTRLLTRSPTPLTTLSSSSKTTSSPAAFSSILKTVSRQSWKEDEFAATETCC
jgi:hypothetical protein